LIEVLDSTPAERLDGFVGKPLSVYSLITREFIVIEPVFGAILFTVITIVPAPFGCTSNAWARLNVLFEPFTVFEVIPFATKLK
jgi:hypothetical protein